MRRWLAPCGFCLVVLTISSLMVSVAAAADPSDAVPDSASVVVRLKAPEATLGNLGDFVDAVQPGVGAVVKGNLAMLGLAISNPTLAGVDAEKDWWVIAFVESRQKPTLVFVVPAKDADALKNALPPGFHYHAADTLAIYSDNEEALAKVRHRVSGKGTALWSKVDAVSKKLFDAADLSVFINLQQLTKAFESELNQAEPQLDMFLNQISGAIPDAQRTQIVPVLDMYRVLGKSAVQGARDSNSLTLTVSFSKDAIRFEDRLQVAEGTKTAKFLAAQPTSDLSLMSRLPAGKPIYFGMKADMAGMVDWSMNMTKGMMVSASEEQKSQFDAALQEMRGLKWNEMAGYFSLDATNPGAIRAGTVGEITPTKRLREISHNMIKAMKEIQSIGFKQTTKLEPAAEKIGGVEVDRITMQQEFDESLDPQGIQKKLRNALFGEEGMQQLVMYQPTRTLQTFGGGLTELENLVTALGSTSKTDAARTTARKRFVDQANVVIVADVPQLMVSAIRLAARELPVPINAAVLDGLQFPPSFIGAAFACEPTAARVQCEIPVAQAQGIAKVVMLLIPRAR